MKRVVLCTTPPLAFALAAVIAWWSGQAAESEAGTADQVRKSTRSERAIVVPDEPRAVLQDLEEKFVNFKAPAKERMDAERMEVVLAQERYRRNSSFVACGGGFEDFVLSSDWAEQSPSEMFSWLIHEGGSSGGERLGYANMLFEKWASSDLPKALAELPKISDPMVRAQALLSILGVVCKSNPVQAKELLVQNLELLGHSPMTYGFGSGKKTMCDLLLLLPSGEERNRLLAQTLKDMIAYSSNPQQDVRGAQAIWDRIAPDLRHELVARGLTNSAYGEVSLDGLDVFMREKAEASVDPSETDRFIELQGKAWAQRDLASAFAWSQAHLKGKKRVEKSAGLFEYAASQDLDNALRVWEELPEGILKDRAAESLSKGAPEPRKSEVEEIVRSQSEPTR